MTHTASTFLRQPHEMESAHALNDSAGLQSSSLFRGLSLQDCSRVQKESRIRRVNRSDFVFLQGDPSSEVTLISSGHVKLTRLQSEGSELILSIRSPLDTLDLPILPRCKHRVTAQAMTECKLLSWSLPVLESCMLSLPQLGRNIHGIMLAEVAELQARYCELSLDKVERRVACTIVRLSKRMGIRTDRGIDLHISRQELAQMTGTTLFTVSRLVSRWGDDGFLLPRREAILIVNPAAMAALAHSDGGRQTAKN